MSELIDVASNFVDHCFFVCGCEVGVAPYFLERVAFDVVHFDVDAPLAGWVCAVDFGDGDGGVLRDVSQAF